MTPPEHLFIGLSLGNTVYATLSFCRRRLLSYGGIVIIAGLMALLPDIDSLFGHYGSADVFTGHRGITHSLLFVLSFSALLTALVALMRRVKGSSGADAGEGRKGYIAAFFLLSVLAGTSHLVADLPQPPGSWGGIPLFFPLSSNGEFIRTGGWGLVGWYDYQVMWTFIFLFLLSLPLIILLGILRRRAFRKSSMAVAAAVILLNISAYAWTVRHVAADGYTDFAGWNRLQERRLDAFGPGVKEATLRGRDRFLELFHRVR